MFRRLVINQSLPVHIDKVAVKHVDVVRYLVLRGSPHTTKFSSKICHFQTLSNRLCTVCLQGVADTI